MKTKPNDHVNPLVVNHYKIESNEFREDVIHPGLTKREYFAAMAMQGLTKLVPSNPCVSKQESYEIALYSTMIADALIEELNKDKKDE